MKLKNGFVLEEVGGAYIAVAVGDEAASSNALIRMNGSGAYLWRLLASEECTEDELVAALLSEYDVDREIAVRDVRAFIARLTGAGLLAD